MSGWDVSRSRPVSPPPAVREYGDVLTYRRGRVRRVHEFACYVCRARFATAHATMQHYRHVRDGHAEPWRDLVDNLEYALRYADAAGVSLARQSVEYAQFASGPRLIMADTEDDHKLRWPPGVADCGVVRLDTHVEDQDGYCAGCGWREDHGPDYVRVAHHPLMYEGGRGCGDNWWYRVLVAEYTQSGARTPTAFTKTRVAAELLLSNHAWTRIDFEPRRL
jgi:hypothetical protein